MSFMAPPNPTHSVNVALGGLCVVLLATSPFPSISKDSMILECSTFGASRSQKGSETPDHGRDEKLEGLFMAPKAFEMLP